MDVRLSEEQQLLRESARDFLATQCPMSLVRESMESTSGFSESLWKRMCELGWPGLIVPDAYGGAGLGAVELSLVLMEMGRTLAPVPLLSTAIAGLAISQSGDEAACQRWLPRIAEGSLCASLAQLESPVDWGESGIALAAHQEGGELVLTGAKHFVSDAMCVDLFVVPVRSDDGGVAIVGVEAGQPGVSVAPTAYNDPVRRVGSVAFDRVRVPESGLICGSGEGWRRIAGLHDHARVALCAELCGVADRSLELAVEYAKTREQFGQAIGRFQAIQHKCAEMLVQLENMRSASLYAAWTLSAGEDDAHSAACLAKAHCSDAAASITSEAIQIHGGLGFTWEQDPHLYYKRAKADELAFGSPSHHRELAARVLIDGLPTPDGV